MLSVSPSFLRKAGEVELGTDSFSYEPTMRADDEDDAAAAVAAAADVAVVVVAVADT